MKTVWYWKNILKTLVLMIMVVTIMVAILSYFIPNPYLFALVYYPLCGAFGWWLGINQFWKCYDFKYEE